VHLPRSRSNCKHVFALVLAGAGAIPFPAPSAAGSGPASW